MKQIANETIAHQECPASVARELRLAGGDNRYGEPNFRVVWGYDRIVPMTGQWEEWKKYVAVLTDKLTGHMETREFIKLDRSVIETRQVPKYLPANCWHLEMWRPPEEYGTPESWRKVGEEILAGMTIDTAGEFPVRGEYELVMSLTTDCTSSGDPLPLVADVVSEIVRMIIVGRDRFSFQQRKAAIEQRLRREEEGFTRKAIDIMKDGMRPFCSETFVTVPKETN